MGFMEFLLSIYSLFEIGTVNLLEEVQLIIRFDSII